MVLQLKVKFNFGAIIDGPFNLFSRYSVKQTEGFLLTTHQFNIATGNRHAATNFSLLTASSVLVTGKPQIFFTQDI